MYALTYDNNSTKEARGEGSICKILILNSEVLYYNLKVDSFKLKMYTINPTYNP